MNLGLLSVNAQVDCRNENNTAPRVINTCTSASLQARMQAHVPGTMRPPEFYAFTFTEHTLGTRATGTWTADICHFSYKNASMMNWRRRDNDRTSRTPCQPGSHCGVCPGL